MLQTSLHEEFEGGPSWMPESDISVVDINRQQRELQRIERTTKRKFVRGNPRK